MKTLISALIVAQFILQPIAQAAETRMPDKVMRHIITQVRLDKALTDFNAVKNQKEFEKVVLPGLLPRDHEFAKEMIKAIKMPPKFTRLNRGVAFEYNGQHFTITVENLSERRYKINNKVIWIYSADNPLRVQADVIARGLEKQASLFDLFIEPADASVAQILIGIVATIFIGTMVTPVGQDLTMNFFYPKYKSNYCLNRVKESSFEDFKYCEEYHKWKEEIRKSKVTVPDAKPVQAAKATEEQVKLSYTCPSKNEAHKEMVVIAEGKIEVDKKMHKIVSRHTIKFGEDNKPKKIVQETIEPPMDRRIEFELGSNNAIETITDNNGKLLSRKVEHASVMNAQKFKEMASLESVIAELIGFVISCNKKADEINAAADAPSLLTSAETFKQGTPQLTNTSETFDTTVKSTK